MKGDFYWSEREDGKRWHGPYLTRDDAVGDAGNGYGVIGAVYVGVEAEVDLNEFCSSLGEKVVEDIGERLSIEYEDLADDWGPRIDSLPPLDDLLRKIVVEWLKSNGHQPKWFAITNVTKVVI